MPAPTLPQPTLLAAKFFRPAAPPPIIGPASGVVLRPLVAAAITLAVISFLAIFGLIM